MGFTNTSSEYIGEMTLKIFIQKKIDMLENISYHLRMSDDFLSYIFVNILCTESNRKDSIADINKSLEIHYSLKSKHQNYIINVLKQEHYLLRISTINKIRNTLGRHKMKEMKELHFKIYNYINNKILSKILFIEKNQKLLIKNQKILMESMNHINGTNYSIQVNKYLHKTLNNPNIINKLLHFYNDIVKKFNAYNLAATVLSSGEIDVNNSMTDTKTTIVEAGIVTADFVGDSIPFGKAASSIAAAAGMYYINNVKTEKNENYYAMIDSVIHTEGISKLSGLKIIKQLDFNNYTIDKINKKYIDYLTNEWRETQLYLIKYKLLPLYENDTNDIEELIRNITTYHNHLCSIILYHFIERINSNHCFSRTLNCFKCIQKRDIINPIINIKSDIDELLEFMDIKNIFNYWKYTTHFNI